LELATLPQPQSVAGDAAQSAIELDDARSRSWGSRSWWTHGERLGAVLEGRRHWGTAPIFVSTAPFSAADTESHLRDLIRDVVVLREPEIAGAAGVSPAQSKIIASRHGLLLQTAAKLLY